MDQSISILEVNQINKKFCIKDLCFIKTKNYLVRKKIFFFEAQESILWWVVELIHDEVFERYWKYWEIKKTNFFKKYKKKFELLKNLIEMREMWEGKENKLKQQILELKNKIQETNHSYLAYKNFHTVSWD